MDIIPVFETNRRPIVIAGPCSAETEEQVLDTAHQIVALGEIDYFRAGVWKPRTRPNSFEGVGKPALAWLKRVKEETGLKTTIEVASAAHVYEALKHGIDMLWIGARSTVNPFTIQDIADALEGASVPVLVKNPVNADLDLWIGAIERIAGAGIKRVGAIHRGFSMYGNTQYRNAPLWQMPIELLRRYPDITLINDPSHICGNREGLMAVAQQAMDLNFHGLMIETHRNPHEAWTDANQQVTPSSLFEMLQNLIFRLQTFSSDAFQEELEQCRRQIDNYDDEILHLLGNRMKVSERIGTIKKANNVAILQQGRWAEIFEKAISKGKKEGLTETFVASILRAINEESIHHQSRIMKNDPDKNLS